MRNSFLILGIAVFLFSQSCYRLRLSKGGGQIKTISERKINTNDIAVSPGYRVEAVVQGLSFPTGITFDDKGNAYVVEAGYSYGEVWTEPKLLRIGSNGNVSTIATGEKNGPWTGVTFFDGSFYIAEGGEANGGKILKVSQDGKILALIDHLPSIGDHHTNGPVINKGYIYFGQGTATNSAIVGQDNADFGWLTRHKDFHDIPCADIILNGQNYSSKNPLTDDPNDEATTGAYSPFNTLTIKGQTVPGSVPCNGSIMRIPVNGGLPELVAWGLRNPFGLAFTADGNLYITDNGFDERGSRPVWGTGDVLWKIENGKWYGWPDFSAGRSLNDEEFKSPGKEIPKLLLQQYPGDPPTPTAVFGVHSSANGIDFAPQSFGFNGEAFVALFGDMSPGVGKVLSPVGFKVVRVNINNGVIRDFAVNKGKRNGPGTWIGTNGMERPVSLKFDPSGRSLYVVDFGIMKTTKDGPEPQLKTGVIWRITKE